MAGHTTTLHPFITSPPRFYKSRAKNAQEAHEAVRPTRPSLSPAQLPGGLDRDCRLLYELIWRRTMACQMANAQIEQVGGCWGEGGEVRGWG